MVSRLLMAPWFPNFSRGVGGPNEKAPSAAATMAPSIFWADQGAVGGWRGKPKGLLRNLAEGAASYGVVRNGGHVKP